MKAHAPFAPSSARRWMECPGSVKAAREVPPAPSSPAADEGTWAHAVAQYMIEERKKPQSLFGMSIAGKKVNEELVDSLKEYQRTVKPLQKVCDLSAVEKLVTLVEDLCWGTADFLAYQHNSTGGALHIVDFKYGIGYPVLAQDNPQLVVYALAAQQTFELTRLEQISVYVVQPRAWMLPKTRVWSINAQTLALWRDRIFRAIEAAMKPDAPRKAGMHCHWCPAAAYCKDFHDTATARISRETQEFLRMKGALEEHNPEALIQALAAVDRAEEWAKSVKFAAISALENGVNLREWVLEPTRPTQQWIDQGNVAHTLSKAFNRPVSDFIEPISPARARDLLGNTARVREVISGLTEARSTGRKTLKRLSGTVKITRRNGLSGKIE